MEFRQLLGHLEDMTLASGEQEFDSRQVSLYILRQLMTRHYETDLRIALANRVKRISNDLNRLYRMQLLKRKRVKRTCKIQKLSGDGKTCVRGFMFKYSFTKQGLRYVRYLRTNKGESLTDEALRQAKDLEKNPSFLRFRIIIQRVFPPQLALIAWKYALFLSELRGSTVKLKGRYRRFPPKIDALLLILMAKIAVESKSKDEMFYELEKVADELAKRLKKRDAGFAEQIRHLEDVSERFFKVSLDYVQKNNVRKSVVDKNDPLYLPENGDS